MSESSYEFVLVPESEMYPGISYEEVDRLTYQGIANQLEQLHKAILALKNTAPNGVTASELGQAASSLSNAAVKFSRCVPQGVECP